MAQSARIRSRFRQLLASENVSQTEIARRIGISQQVFNRIFRGDPAGLYVAQRLAKFDRIPVESILDGVPPSLEVAIREAAMGRWSEPTKAAVRKFAASAEADRIDRYDVPQWGALLDKVERTIGPIVRDELSKKR